MKNHHRIRYAVVGLGHIAQTAVLPAFANAENSELVALISQDADKSSTLGERYQVPAYHYDDLERAIDKERVEAVFIALPNTMHREFTERAARKGVHVLCEKPLATTEEDCRAMILACQAAKVFLMTAYRLHFTDAHVCAIEMAKSGDLGELRFFNSIFSMQVEPGNTRTQRELGGGPLFDIGIYCINAARYLFQDEPLEVLGVTMTGDDERFAEVEEMATATLKFPGARVATFTCSLGASDRDSLELVGTECALHVEPAYGYEGELKWKLKRGDREEERTFPAGDQFAGEIVYFSKCIQQGEKPEPSGAEGLADVRIINAIYESARTGRPVPVNAVHKSSHIESHQLMKFPPTPKEEEFAPAEASKDW